MSNRFFCSRLKLGYSSSYEKNCANVMSSPAQIFSNVCIDGVFCLFSRLEMVDWVKPEVRASLYREIFLAVLIRSILSTM